MDNKDKYFTDELKEIFNKAKEQMNITKSMYIDTFHFILAILDYDFKDNLMMKYVKLIFEENNITYDTYLDNYKRIIGEGKEVSKFKVFTPLLKKIIDDKYNLAKQYNAIIETQDIAFEILKGDNVATRIIINEFSKDKLKSLISYMEKNDNKQISMEKERENNMNKDNNNNRIINFYDFYITLDGENIVNVQSSKIFFVNKQTYNKILNGKFNFNLEMKSLIESTYLKEMNDSYRKGCKIYLAIFVPIIEEDYMNRELQDGVVVTFAPNSSGNLSSNIKTFMTDECSEELQEFIISLGKIKETSNIDSCISGFKKSSKNIIYNAQSIEDKNEERREENHKQKQKELEEKRKKEELNKCSCLINLNEKVKRDDTVIIGLEEEFMQLLKNLTHMRKPNVMLLGEPGVGKTALIEKLACEINNGTVPSKFNKTVIYELSMPTAVAGTKYRGEFEEKIVKVLELVKDNPNIILFIDEAHTMMGAGGAEGSIDASNILKPYLARASIKVVGATTKKEYEEYIKKDGAIVRRFNNIEILEPMENETKNIMRGLKPKLEKFYEINIDKEIIDESYEKAKSSKNKMPDAALDELENWCIDKYFSKFEKEKEATK